MRRFVIAPLVCLLTFPIFAQDDQSRFEIAKNFVLSWSDSPARDVPATIACASTVHRVEKDCEMHIVAEFTNPSFSDFPGVMLKPPNLCKFPKTPWRADCYSPAVSRDKRAFGHDQRQLAAVSTAASDHVFVARLSSAREMSGVWSMEVQR